MASKGASIQLQIVYGWWTWAALYCPVQLHHEVHLEMWWYVGYCRDLFLHDVSVTLNGLWWHTMIYFSCAALGRAQLPFDIFIAGWLVFSVESKNFQLPNAFCFFNRYVCFPNGTLRFHFWTKCLMYEIVCSGPGQMCCRKEQVCCTIATKDQSSAIV